MAIEMMLTQMARNWGWIVLRGVAAILFGILSFAWPGLTLAVLVIVWGAYALADGLFALMAGIRLKMWPLTIVGLLGICAGIFTFLRPGITALVLLGLIAVWALATGIFQVAAAIHFRKMISNEWMLILSGVLSIAFGAAMLARPGAGALAVVWLIGWFATLNGVMQVVLGFRLRGLGGRMVPKPA
jgi:uncharacterized membrane protein HdeD (DUF308 family)